VNVPAINGLPIAQQGALWRIVYSSVKGGSFVPIGTAVVINGNTQWASLYMDTTNLLSWLSRLQYLPPRDFFGNDAITLELWALSSPNTQQKYSSVTIAVAVSPINHAPTLTAPKTIPFPFGQDALLSAVVVGDVDTNTAVSTVWAAFPATSELVVPAAVPMTLMLFSTSGFFNSSGQTHAAWSGSGNQGGSNQFSRVTLTGTIANLNAALAQTVYSNPTLGSVTATDAVQVLILDNGNAGLPALSATATIQMSIICNNQAAPQLASIRIADSLTSVVLTFDAPFVISAIAGDSLASYSRRFDSVV
jgi:hypothetical protein